MSQRSSQEDENRVRRGEICDCQIEPAVAIEVTHGDTIGTGAGSEIDVGPECSIAVAQQNGHGVRNFVSDGHVDFAVPVVVAQCHERRSGSRGVIDVGLERPVAIAQQDRNEVIGAVSPACRDEVQNPVPLKSATVTESGDGPVGYST